jgi:hypothetical protein
MPGANGIGAPRWWRPPQNEPICNGREGNLNLTFEGPTLSNHNSLTRWATADLRPLLESLFYEVRYRLTNVMLADNHFDRQGLTNSTNWLTGADIDQH